MWSTSRVETFGCAVLEAIAAGVPVVATRAGALPELLAPGLGLFANGPEDFAYATERVLDLDWRRQAEAAAPVLAQFDRPHVGSALLELYRRLLGG